MNSFFAQFYLDLCERIKQEVPEIEWIEQDFGQDAFDKWRPNVAFPAVLIDFPNANYSAESGLSQFGNVTVALRLLVAPFSQSYDDAPVEVKQDALDYFELEAKLVEALHGWAPDAEYCQPLIRESITSNNRNDIGLRIRNLTFSTAYEEDFE
jgi:hypothetical protein